MGKPNWENQTIWTGDNLDIMRGMNSSSVDLIYLDPPFNSNKTYAAPIGSEAAGAAFKDSWTLSDVDEAWHGEISDRDPALYGIIDAAGHAHGKSMKSYLIMMAVRLMELYRILTETGSIYLHCDPTASHYLKLLMDAVFGCKHFRNELIWHYGQRTLFMRRQFNRKHDVILFYARSDKTVLNKISTPWDEKDFFTHRHDVKYDESGNAYILSDAGETGKRYKRPAAEVMAEGKPIDSVWGIPILNSSAKERTGYPTQKPLSLLDRIVRSSSNPGDVIFDPFCGCATACVAAEQNERQWMGIDISPLAYTLVRSRLRKEIGMLAEKTVNRTDIPRRTDQGPIVSYKTHKHTLFGKQEGVCNGCRHSFQFRNFTIDHTVPQAKGGTDHLDNLQLLCGACNSMKGSGTQEALIAKLKQEGIR